MIQWKCIAFTILLCEERFFVQFLSFNSNFAKNIAPQLERRVSRGYGVFSQSNATTRRSFSIQPEVAGVRERGAMLFCFGRHNLQEGVAAFSRVESGSGEPPDRAQICPPMMLGPV